MTSDEYKDTPNLGPVIITCIGIVTMPILLALATPFLMWGAVKTAYKNKWNLWEV